MKNKLLLLSGLLIVVLMSCHKDNTAAKNSSAQTKDSIMNLPPVYSIDGYGYSNKPLSGRPFLLPAGVTMVGSVMTGTGYCYSCNHYEWPTTGELWFNFTLQNSNSVATRIIFLAGIVFPSPDTTQQNAVIVQPDTAIIPANSSLLITVNAYCLNEFRTFGTSTSIPYGNMLISNNNNLTPMIQLLSTKKPIAYDVNEIV